MAHRTTNFRRVLATLLIIYAGLCLFVFATQRRLIYFPTRLSSSAAERAAAEQGFTAWRNAGGQIIGWKLGANSSPTGSVLVVHGNAGSAVDRDYLARPIHNAAPVDVFILEYPGYGARGGSPNLKSWLAAGEEAFGALPRDTPRYVVSESIGAGVAAHIARTHPKEVAGVAMIVPYADLAAVAQNQMRLFPAYFLLRDRFRPAEWLKQYQGPVKVLVAEKDEIIPARYGHRLFDSYHGPKDLDVIEGARHNDVAEQSPEWWREVFAFWKTNSAAMK
jgi:pimeloyl-ACP methyl ester carboxylesterase